MLSLHISQVACREGAVPKNKNWLCSTSSSGQFIWGLYEKTGDNFGLLANDKLKITRGKDFRKEKTKFKNKTSAGGMTISQTVRSIQLESDSD